MPDKRGRNVSNLNQRIPTLPEAPTVTATDVGTSRAYNDGAANLSITPAVTGGLTSLYSITTTPTTVTTNTTSTSPTITGLSSDTSYTVSVTPSNASYTGPATTSSSFTATTVPQAPTIGTVTDLETGGSVTVGFTAGATGGKSITGYTATSSPGSITGTGASSPITVSGLTNGTAYTFTVTATNANGTSSASSASASVTPTVPAFESIATVTGTGSSETITFSSIPGTYQHLQIRGIAKTSNTATFSGNQICSINFNSDAGSNYAKHRLTGNGSVAATAGSASQGAIDVIGATNSGTGHTNIMGAFVIDILDYASTSKNTTVRALSGTDGNTASTSFVVALSSGVWLSTSAVTSISLIASANWTTQTTFALYGIKGA